MKKKQRSLARSPFRRPQRRRRRTPPPPQAGSLISLSLPRRRKWLDGFWTRCSTRASTLLIYVHGMGGTFYRSRLTREFLRQGTQRGFDVLAFNNRGHDAHVADERFSDSLADLDAAMRFAASRGYRRVMLLGHSTGSQKISYFQARRRDPRIAALVLLAPGDDYAISRRNLGRHHARWIRRARQLVAEGRGDTRLPSACLGFSARRFLSVADRRSTEAALFDYEGPMRLYGQIKIPVLAVFGDREEYACMPVPAMGQILKEKSRSRQFGFAVIRGGDHSFHEHEAATVRLVLSWLRKHSG